MNFELLENITIDRVGEELNKPKEERTIWVAWGGQHLVVGDNGILEMVDVEE